MVIITLPTYYTYFHLKTMAIGHSSARCWPCELRWGSFNSATSSAHKQYIRWEFSAVARTFNELLQPWWCIHCVIVLAFEVILLGDLPYKIAQQDRLSAAESTRRIESVQYSHSSIKRPFEEHYVIVSDRQICWDVGHLVSLVHCGGRFVCCVCERHSSIT